MAIEQQLTRECDVAHEGGFRVLFLPAFGLPSHDTARQIALECAPRNSAIPATQRVQPRGDPHRKLQQWLGKKRRNRLRVRVRAKWVVVLGGKEELRRMKNFSV